MENFDVFRLNGVDNCPAAGEFFLEHVILKVSQTHFSKDFYSKGWPMPPLASPRVAYIFQGGGGGAVKYLGGGGGGGGGGIS